MSGSTFRHIFSRKQELPCGHVFHTHCLRCAGSSAYAGLLNSGVQPPSI